jgi:hypothetical protein
MKAIAFSLGTCTPLMTMERPEGEVPASLVPLQAPLLGRPHRSDMPHVVAEVQSGSGGQEGLPVLATPLVAMPLEPVPVLAAPLAAVPLLAAPLDAPAPLLVTDPALEAPVLAPPPPVLAPLPLPPPLPPPLTTTTATVPEEGVPPPDAWTPQERAALATRRPRLDIQRARCPMPCVLSRRPSTSQSLRLYMCLQFREQRPGFRIERIGLQGAAQKMECIRGLTPA